MHVTKAEPGFSVWGLMNRGLHPPVYQSRGTNPFEYCSQIFPVVVDYP